MKILLTGATGYIGKRLLPVLVDAGHQVIGCVRDPNRFDPPESLKLKIKIIKLNLWGEAYFAKELLDYELTSNNGNWQWAVRTGCDAAQYFRIFNPIEQLKKFDKNENYIKSGFQNWEQKLIAIPLSNISK